MSTYEPLVAFSCSPLLGKDKYDGDLVLPRPQEPARVIEKGDSRLRSIAVKFHRDGTQLIVSYVAHGVMYVLVTSYVHQSYSTSRLELLESGRS